MPVGTREARNGSSRQIQKVSPTERRNLQREPWTMMTTGQDPDRALQDLVPDPGPAPLDLGPDLGKKLVLVSIFYALLMSPFHVSFNVIEASY